MDQRPPISESALGNVAEGFSMWQVPFSNIQVHGMMPQTQLGKSYALSPAYFQYQQRYPSNALGNITQGISHSVPNPAYVIRCNERMATHYQQVPSVTTEIFRPRQPGYQQPDPVKLSEQKSKLEKERNFQMQQRKLKQFSQCGLKPSINPDSYISIILGEDQNRHKPTLSNISTKVATDQPVAHSEPAVKVPLETSQEVTSVTWAQQQVTSSQVKQKAIVKNDPSKGLEDMMLACSDLSKPQQSKPFHKLAVNDIKQSSHQKTSCFTDSQKARNWKNIQDLDEFGQIFQLPKTTFPPWCRKDKVPSLYHQVQKIVTGDGNHPIDTQCLYPILLSSGLQRGLLGLIWELISQTTPGQLVEEELYMGLALVALAQAGYKFNSIEILHQLHQPPVPLLQFFTTSVPQATISTLPGGVSNQVMKFPTSSGSTCTSVFHSCPPGEPGVSSVSYLTSVSSTQANSSIFLLPQSQHLSTSYQETTESCFASTHHFPVNSHISLPSHSSSDYQDVSVFSSKSQTFAISSQASVVGSRDSSEMHYAAIVAKPAVDQQALSTLHLSRPIMASSVPQHAGEFPKSHVDPKLVLNSKSTPVDSFQWEIIHPSSQNTCNPHTSIAVHPGGDNLEDDDFDEFQSASVVTTISEVQSHDNLVTSTSPFDSAVLKDNDDDEFDDFKHAVFPTSVGIVTDNKDKTAEKLDSSNCDLMAAEEDKYSVFRLLQEQESNSLQQNSSLLDVVENDSDENQQVPHSKMTSSQDVAVTSNVTENDDFGDFLCASTSSVTVVQDDFQGFESFQTGTAYESFGAFESFKTTESSFANFDQFNINSCGLGQNGPTLTLNLASPPAFQLSDEKDEFGDFTNSQATLPRTETGSELSYHGSSKDNISLAESQSISSLELPTYDSGGHNGESKASLSRHGSIPSLDLKSVNLEETDSTEMMQDNQGNIPSLESAFDKKEGSPEVNFKKTYNDPASSVGPYITSSAALTDRYSSIRTNSENQFKDIHVSEWNRCLTSCQELLYGGWQIFHHMPNSTVCSEVLSTEEGSEYIKNLTEVQRVVQRVKLAIKMSGKETDELQRILVDTDSTWQNILVFLTGTSLMPEGGSLEFSSTILPLDTEDVSKACGVCLLNVEGRSKAFDVEQDSYKLMYGGRQYHAACANLWVNCVDSLLPALPLPHLL